MPVLVNEQRKKLSKRRDKVALEQYRDEGYLADAMVNYLMTLGWTPPGDSEIVDWRDDRGGVPAGGRDPFAGVLRRQEARRVQRRLHPGDAARRVHRAGRARRFPAEWDRDRFAAIAPHIQERLVTFDEVPGKVDFLFWPTDAPIEYDEASWAKAFAPEWARPLLDDLIGRVRRLTPAWTADALKAATEQVMARYELKLGKAQAPPRVAVTGRAVGPPLFESLEVLGRDETLRRLRLAGERVPRSSRSGCRRRRPSDRRADDQRRLIERREPSIGATPGRRGSTPSHDRTATPARCARVADGVVRRRSLLRRLAGVRSPLSPWLYFLFSFWQVWSTGRTDQAGPVDAIVVMGAAQYDGRPSPQLEARLDHVVELWPQDIAPADRRHRRQPARRPVHRSRGVGGLSRRRRHPRVGDPAGGCGHVDVRVARRCRRRCSRRADSTAC